MKYILIFIFFLTTQLTYGKSDTLYSIVYPFVGYPFGVSAPDFFEGYQQITGGEKHNMKATTILGVGLKYQISDVSRVGMTASWMQARFTEGFHQKIYPNSDESPYRYLSEEITINDMQILAVFDYCPYMKKQFDTYISAGLGMNVSNVVWEEFVHSPFKWDLRTTGTRIDGNYISLLSRIALGMELGWDKRREDALLGDLILEAAYVYDFKTIKMFEDFHNQFEEPMDIINKKIKMLPNYFTFSIAVSLNLVQYLGVPAN